MDFIAITIFVAALWIFSLVITILLTWLITYYVLKKNISKNNTNEIEQQKNSI